MATFDADTWVWKPDETEQALPAKVRSLRVFVVAVVQGVTVDCIAGLPQWITVKPESLPGAEREPTAPDG